MLSPIFGGYFNQMLNGERRWHSRLATIGSADAQPSPALWARAAEWKKLILPNRSLRQPLSFFVVLTDQAIRKLNEFVRDGRCRPANL
jgi:hypothetical protein